MQTVADEVLIARIAKGDRLAMAALFGRYRVPVYRFVLRMVRNEATAEDLNSDVFLDVWRQAGTFEGRSAVSTCSPPGTGPAIQLSILFFWTRPTPPPATMLESCDSWEQPLFSPPAAWSSPSIAINSICPRVRST